MKIFFITAVIVMAFTSVSEGQQTANVSIVHHNIHSGGQPQEAADHIVELMDLTPQKMLVLVNEANYARQYFDLPHAGWDYIWKASPHEGRGNAIFTRDAAATLMDSWVLSMAEPWIHNQLKDPRVYPVVVGQLVSSPWVEFTCVNVHFPTNRDPEFNAPARQESVDRLIQLSNNQSDRPLIICGDFNMGVNEVRRRIADEIGGRIYSDASVDHIIVRDGSAVGIDNVEVNKLGLMGSDHHAIRYNFSFVELDSGSAVSDWSLY